MAELSRILCIIYLMCLIAELEVTLIGVVRKLEGFTLTCLMGVSFLPVTSLKGFCIRRGSPRG